MNESRDHAAAARAWLEQCNLDWHDGEYDSLEQMDKRRNEDRESLASLLAETAAAARRLERERCDKAVDSQLEKLGRRWSLDSAYLNQALDLIRAGDAAGRPGE